MKVKKYVLWTLFFLFLIYSMVGFFPIVPLEDDGVWISNGISQMQYSDYVPEKLIYRYPVQSGTYHLINAFSFIKGMNSFEIFSTLSSISCVIYVLFSVLFLNKITKVSIPICGIFLLLFQEVMAGGYYSNSNAIAAPFAIGALYLVSVNTRIVYLVIAGLLFSIAGWMRFDALLLTPAVLVLVHKNSFKKTILKTLCVAVVTSVTILFIFYITQINFDSIFSAAQRHLEKTSNIRGTLGLPFLGLEDVKSYLSAFSFLNIFLMSVGIYIVIKYKRWRNLILFLSGVVPFYMFYWGHMTTPKYMYSIIPFYLIPVCMLFQGNNFKIRAKRALVTIGVSLFLLQYIFAVRIDLDKRPYVKDPYPTIFKLCSLDTSLGPINNVEVAIGSGTIITTDDGYRLSSGIFFHPLAWRRNKKAFNNSLKIYEDYFNKNIDKNKVIVTTYHNSKILTIRFLLNQGFKVKEYSSLFLEEIKFEKYIFERNSTSVILFHGCGAVTVREYPVFEKFINMFSENTGYQNFIYITTSGWQNYFFTKNLKQITGYNDVHTFSAYEVNM